MTERRRPINPIILTEQARTGRNERGTPASLQQLQEHCDKLNSFASDRYWYVERGAEGYTCMYRPRTGKPSEPRCTPQEARQILARYPNSAFARTLLAYVEQPQSDERKAA